MAVLQLKRSKVLRTGVSAPGFCPFPPPAAHGLPHVHQYRILTSALKPCEGRPASRTTHLDAAQVRRLRAGVQVVPQVAVEALKHQVHVAAVDGGDDVLELHDVVVAELTQRADLSYGAVAEAVVHAVHDLLDGNHLVRLAVDGLVHDAIGAAAQLSNFDVLKLLQRTLEAGKVQRGGEPLPRVPPILEQQVGELLGLLGSWVGNRRTRSGGLMKYRLLKQTGRGC